MHLLRFLFVGEMKNLIWVDITRNLIKSKYKHNHVIEKCLGKYLGFIKLIDYV